MRGKREIVPPPSAPPRAGHQQPPTPSLSRGQYLWVEVHNFGTKCTSRVLPMVVNQSFHSRWLTDFNQQRKPLGQFAGFIWRRSNTILRGPAVTMRKLLPDSCTNSTFQAGAGILNGAKVMSIGSETHPAPRQWLKEIDCDFFPLGSSLPPFISNKAQLSHSCRSMGHDFAAKEMNCSSARFLVLNGNCLFWARF